VVFKSDSFLGMLQIQHYIYCIIMLDNFTLLHKWDKMLFISAFYLLYLVFSIQNDHFGNIL